MTRLFLAAGVAALAIAVSAFGALNCMILATGELAYAMGLRGDIPAVMARTGRDNIPYVAHLVGGVLTVALIVANASKTTAGLFTFVILLSTAAVLVVYALGALAAWKENAAPGSRAIVVVALLFIAFAAYGSGLKADLWCVVLLAGGIAVSLVMRSRGGSIRVAAANPAAPPESAV